MKEKQLCNRSRLMGAALILSCVWSNLLPFFFIDLKIMELTLLRLVLFSVSGYCVYVWGLGIFRRRGLLPWRKYKAEWLTLGFFCLWSVCALVWLLFFVTAESAPTEVIGIVSVFLYAFCFFTLIKEKLDVLFLLRICVLCGIALSLMADAEIVVGSLVKGTKNYYTLEQRVQMQQTLFAPTTVFHNPNDLATFLLMCLSIVAVWFLRARRRRDMALCAGAALALLWPTPIINSTLFRISFVLLTALTVGILLFQNKQLGRIRWYKAAGAALFAVLFLFPISAFVKETANRLNRAYFSGVISQGEETQDETAFFPFEFQDNDSLITQMEAAIAGSGTIHTRYWLIRAGLDYAGQHPVFGCGPGGFRRLMKDPENEEYLKKVRGVVDPHNFYIELLSQYGSIVFALYLGILMYLLAASGKRAAAEARMGTARLGTQAFTLLFFFAFCGIIPSSIIRLMPLWLFFVLGVSALGRSMASSER